MATIIDRPPVKLRLAETDMSKRETARFGKLDQRYWRSRLLVRTSVRGGGEARDANYFVRIQYKGRRYLFDTGHADKSAACRASAAIYQSVVKNGWDATISGHAESLGKGQRSPKVEPAGTLGSLIAAYEAVSTTQESSRLAYYRAIRKIYADINRVPGGRKHDTRRGGRDGWVSVVDALPLASVTPAKVVGWKQGVMQTGGEANRRRAIVTANSLIRNARSLFCRRLLQHIKERAILPDVLPFDGVLLDKPPSTRYRSRTDAVTVLSAARAELYDTRPECFMIVCLALQCGLRRAEIDSLLWRSVDLARQVIHVESNEYYNLKSEDSHGEVDIGETLLECLAIFHERRSGAFVIESATPATVHRGSGGYRCREHFGFVTRWLRKLGIDVNRPLHELRKEVGSVIAQEHGIFAASRFLRHSDIRITSSYYVDKKQRVLPSFG